MEENSNSKSDKYSVEPLLNSRTIAVQTYEWMSKGDDVEKRALTDIAYLSDAQLFKRIDFGQRKFGWYDGWPQVI